MSLELLQALVAPLLPARRERSVRALEGIVLEHIADIETLRLGWKRVRANKGGPGGDGVTVEAFAADLDRRISSLSEKLLSETYRPLRLRSAIIGKPDGGKRHLRIPAVVDRVAQTAALIALAPTLDPKMSDASWAYRAGRGVRDALFELKVHYQQGYVWTIDADIEKYFDRVPQGRLLEELSIWIDDERVIRLFGHWLRSFSTWGRGIAQGAPVSPLLANLFLHPMDRLLVAEGSRVVRYADDFLVLCRGEREAKAALQRVRRLLRTRGLSLNDAKTRLISPGGDFVFLGERVHAGAGEAAADAPALGNDEGSSLGLAT